jgi:hypothetical protein
MASIQFRPTTSLVQNLDVNTDGWGFDTENQCYLISHNYEDGSRIVELYPLANMERHIRIVLDADEVKELDAKAEKNKPPS